MAFPASAHVTAARRARWSGQTTALERCTSLSFLGLVVVVLVFIVVIVIIRIHFGSSFQVMCNQGASFASGQQAKEWRLI